MSTRMEWETQTDVVQFVFIGEGKARNDLHKRIPIQPRAEAGKELRPLTSGVWINRVFIRCCRLKATRFKMAPETFSFIHSLSQSLDFHSKVDYCSCWTFAQILSDSFEILANPQELCSSIHNTNQPASIKSIGSHGRGWNRVDFNWRNRPDRLTQSNRSRLQNEASDLFNKVLISDFFISDSVVCE